jgi:hypothetical protein
LLAGVLRYAAERSGQDQKFTKYPATWLSKKCWLDEPTTPPITGTTMIDASGNPVDYRPPPDRQRATSPSWMDVAMAGLNRRRS